MLLQPWDEGSARGTESPQQAQNHQTRQAASQLRTKVQETCVSPFSPKIPVQRYGNSQYSSAMAELSVCSSWQGQTVLSGTLQPGEQKNGNSLYITRVVCSDFVLVSAAEKKQEDRKKYCLMGSKCMNQEEAMGKIIVWVLTG